MTRSEVIGIHKAVLWEQAKGTLRAMVAAEGRVSSHDPADEQRRTRWRDAESAIDQFIEQFESNGLHE